MFAQFSAAALNHLLMQNNWALPRLQKFSGQTARFNIAPFTLAFTILDSGLIRDADIEEVGTGCTCSLALTLLPRLALHDQNAYQEINVEGNPALLSEIFFLSKNLIWDQAQDLSNFTGDIVAERIVQASNNFHLNLNYSARNLLQATVEFLTEEQPVITQVAPTLTFLQEVDTLRNDSARLELRVKRLTSIMQKEH
jgi:ubiquinone biosynthesis protein UbiJ